LKALTWIKDVEWPELLFCSLFHDIGKGHKDYYLSVDGKYQYGSASKIPHSHLSVFMLKGIDFVSNEMLGAILIHNGMYTGTGEEVMVRHDQSNLAYLLHVADMLSLAYKKTRLAIEKEAKRCGYRVQGFVAARNLRNAKYGF
jgi:hypothetical protein